MVLKWEGECPLPQLPKSDIAALGVCPKEGGAVSGGRRSYLKGVLPCGRPNVKGGWVHCLAGVGASLYLQPPVGHSEDGPRHSLLESMFEALALLSFAFVAFRFPHLFQ